MTTNNLVLRLLTAWVLLTSAVAHGGETVTYYHNDALGSPVAATDASGAVVWREAYKPFGSRIKREATDGNTLWYTGQEEDPDIGLMYYGARWYDPEIGRFMAVDPVGFDPQNVQSFNRYAYANNNPYRYVDPDGRSPFAVPVIPGAFAPPGSMQPGQIDTSQVPSPRELVTGYYVNQLVGLMDTFGMLNDSSAPEVPDSYVGDNQNETKRRVNSDGLAPKHGGSGDPEADFGVLTGGTGRPHPDRKGVLVGDNGIELRPGSKPHQGPRIDIPPKGNKKRETLHYPPKKTK